jgi:hypothetical protein
MKEKTMYPYVIPPQRLPAKPRNQREAARQEDAFYMEHGRTPLTTRFRNAWQAFSSDGVTTSLKDISHDQPQTPYPYCRHSRHA